MVLKFKSEHSPMIKNQNPNIETPEKILTCPISPVDLGQFTELPPLGSKGVAPIFQMPVWHKVGIAGDYETADTLRKACWKNPRHFQGELIARTEGTARDMSYQVIYIVPIGTYYDKVRDWLFEALDSMEKGKVYFLVFKDVDVIQNAFHFVKEWQKDRCCIARLGSTYEGRYMTLRAFLPERLNTYEAMELGKHTSRRDEKLLKLSKAANGGSRGLRNGNLGRAYHDIEVGEEVRVSSDQYTKIHYFRTVVSRYGVSSGKKFSVKSDDAGATVTRIE